MYTPGKYAAKTWLPLKARIPGPKCWYENSYMRMATGTAYTIINFPANPTLFYQNTEP